MIQIEGPSFHSQKTTFAPSPSPYLLLVQEVYNTKTGEKVGEVSEDVLSGRMLALSPDGKHLAFFDVRQSKIKVLLCETGETVCEFLVEDSSESRPGTQSQSKAQLKFLEFFDDHRLYGHAIWDLSGGILVWEIPTGNVLGRVPTTNRLSSVFAPSKNRKFIAMLEDSAIRIKKLADGKTVLQMENPTSSDKPSKEMFKCDRIAFSPDGKELAALALKSQQLVCWNQKSKVVLHHTIPRHYRIPSRLSAGLLQWSPDGNGWLVGGIYYLDRRLKRVVWGFDNRREAYGVRFLDADTLLIQGSVDFRSHAWIHVPFPRDKIDRAVAAMESEQDAPLRPGDSVSLQVNIGELHMVDHQYILSTLTDTITSQLTENGFDIAPDQPIRLEANYAEQGGQPPQESIGRLELRITSDNGNTLLWERTLTFEKPNVIASGKNKTTVGGVLPHLVSGSIIEKKIPYFISADPSIPTLPIILSKK